MTQRDKVFEVTNWPKFKFFGGRDLSRGHRCWSFGLVWKLRDDYQPGELRYAHHIEFWFHWRWPRIGVSRM